MPSKLEHPPIAVNHLLLGKKALSSRNKKTFHHVLLPSANNKNKNNQASKHRRLPLRRQMSMDPKMFRMASGTILWKDVKNVQNNRDKQRVPPPIEDIKISSEAEQFAEINARRRSHKTSKTRQETPKKEMESKEEEEGDRDDSSSTSTELCDDPDKALSDFSFEEELSKESDCESAKLSENLNKSAPSTPCDRTLVFFGDDCDIFNGGISPTQSQISACDNDTVDESDNQKDNMDELRQAVQQLKLTPRKYPGDSANVDHENDEVLRIEVDDHAKPVISCSFESTYSSNSVGDRSYSTQSSPASIDSLVTRIVTVSPRNRTMSNPTSPIYERFTVDGILGLDSRRSSISNNNNNRVNGFRDSGKSPESREKHIFNPFPTNRLKTKHLGSKLSMYATADGGGGGSPTSPLTKTSTSHFSSTKNQKNNVNVILK